MDKLNIRKHQMSRQISGSLLKEYIALFDIPSQDRSQEDLEKIMKITENSNFLKNLGDENNSDRIRWECCRAMRFEVYERGEMVFNFGDIGDRFYTIIQGKVTVLVPSKTIKKISSTREGIVRSLERHTTIRSKHKMGKSDEEKDEEMYGSFKNIARQKTEADFDFLDNIGEIEEMNEVKVLKNGDFFGEVALLSNKPRSATVRCETFCCFAVLSRKDYKNILSSNIETSIRERIDFLKNLPIFKKLSPASLRNLSYFITETTYKKNQIVYTENSSIDNVYLIKSGEFSFKVKEHINSSRYQGSATLLKLSMMKKNTKIVDLQVVVKGKNEIFGHEEMAAECTSRLQTSICTSNFGIVYTINISVKHI